MKKDIKTALGWAHSKDELNQQAGVQIGGTYIERALCYYQQSVTRPNDTVLVLITDLYEGGNVVEMKKRILSLVGSGVQLVVLLALNDEGKPYVDHGNSAFLAANNIPAFACTPDLFPDLMANVLQKQNLFQWAATHDVVIAGR
ncbi:MAG: VWA domain-containing protein [Bacteroidota bacterium]